MNPADKIAFLKSLSKAAITNNEIENPSIKALPTLDTVEPKIQPKRESYVSSILESTAESIEQSLQVDAEKLEKTTEQLLKKLKRGSLNSYRAMKEMVWKSLFSGWSEYAELELELQKSLAFTEDFKEGVRAHSEKRRPNFTGK